MIDWKSFAEAALQESNEDIALDYYMPLRIQVGPNRIYKAQETLKSDVLEYRTKRILISGRPGSGKTYLISWLNYELANELLLDVEYFEQQLENQDELQNGNASVKLFAPKETTVVPILVRLNLFNVDDFNHEGTGTRTEVFILNKLSAYGLKDGLDTFIKDGPRFVFLFDDLDEVIAENRNKNLHDVRKCIERLCLYPNVKVVIAGREIAANLFRNRFRSYTVCDLLPEELKDLIGQAADDHDELFTYIEKPDGLLQFLSTPYFAVLAAEFWTDPGDRQFNLGRLLFHLLTHIVYRQRKTEQGERLDQELDERMMALEKLALESLRTDGIVTATQRQKLQEKHLDWFLLMEFISPAPSEYGFTNKWIHAYFAAHLLSRDDFFVDYEARMDWLDKNNTGLNRAVAACIVILEGLTGEEYSESLFEDQNFADYFTDREIEWFSWAFEQKIADYIRRELHFSTIETPYKKPFLDDGEIDIYAERAKGTLREIWIVECKFRLPPYPKDIQEKYITQLHKYRLIVEKVKNEEGKQNGFQVKIVSILATNSGSYPERLLVEAKQNKIEIWDFKLPAYERTARSNITGRMRDNIL